MENKQTDEIKKRLKEKNYICNYDFDMYKNTKSIITFSCDKGHLCETKAKYIIYDNCGCRFCAYEKKEKVLRIDVKDIENKICSKCGELKNNSYFGKLKTNIDGLRHICKLCRRKENLGKLNKRSINSINYCIRHPFRFLSQRCFSNHRKKAFLEKFDVTEDYLIEIYNKQNGKCFWSNNQMSIENVSTSKLDTISVDRIDCNKGYIKDNIVLCFKFFNLGRGNMNYIEFSKFLTQNNLCDIGLDDRIKNTIMIYNLIK